jgi:hypothetical protein
MFAFKQASKMTRTVAALGKTLLLLMPLRVYVVLGIDVAWCSQYKITMA